MKLYEIASAIETAIDGGYVFDEETGEVLFDSENLDELEVAFNEKLESCGLYIKGLLAEAEAIKNEEKILQDRRKAAERKAERLRSYVDHCMAEVGESQLKTPRVAISYRKSLAVEITDETAIPDTLCVSTITMRPDKAAIKRAIQAGETIKGAELVEKQNLVIK